MVAAVVRAATRGASVLLTASDLTTLRACSTELICITLEIRVLLLIAVEQVELVLPKLLASSGIDAHKLLDLLLLLCR